MVIYHNCDTLTLGALIHCLSTEDYRPIIQKGKPAPSDLKVAWEILYSEYLALINNKNASYEIILSCEVQSLFCRYISCSRAVEILYLIPDDEITMNMLRSEGFKITYDPKNISSVKIVLGKCTPRLKRIAFEYEDKKAMLEKLQDNAVSETKTTRAIFTHTLAILARFQSCAVIHPKDITVAQYAAILNQYMEHCAAMEQNLNDGRRANK